MWRGSAGVALLVVTTVAACNAVLGIKDRKLGDGGGGAGATAGAGGANPSVGGAGGTDATTSVGGVGGTGADGGGGTAALVCGDNATCIGSVPDPWVGPLAVDVEDAVGSLADCLAFDQEFHTAFNGLIAEDAMCDCDCAAPMGVDCNVAEVTSYDMDMCFSGGSPHDLSFQICNSLPGPRPSSMITSIGDTAGASCPPIDIENIPPTQWTSSFRSCGALNIGDCGGQPCVATPPSSFDLGICIYQNGDHVCPADFPNRHLIYTGVDDGRGCATCLCGPVAGNCTAAINAYVSPFCPVGEEIPLMPGMCFPAVVQSYRLDAAQSMHQCTPSAPSSTGTQNPTGPLTYCSM